MDIEGVCTIVDFKEIEIVDDSKPYPPLLWLDWKFANMNIINLKKRYIIFEGNNMRVIILLDPLEGLGYTKLVIEEYCIANLDNIYQITSKE